MNASRSGQSKVCDHHGGWISNGYLDMAGLWEKRHLRAKMLTFHERRTLELWALSVKPRLLLLDETMAGLNRRSAPDDGSAGFTKN
jgi:ABC-type branched-subunit amino acid transport system ATPase component